MFQLLSLRAVSGVYMPNEQKRLCREGQDAGEDFSTGNEKARQRRQNNDVIRNAEAIRLSLKRFANI